MEDQILQELSEVIQSSNINILLGAGASTPFLPLLGSIEQALDLSKNDKEREILYKEYFNMVMLPNKTILEKIAPSGDLSTSMNSYENLFLAISEVILQRKSTILSKQVNIFTTNVDILMESCLEKLMIEYNDGFSGKILPTFSTANYKKSIQQRSIHFDHVSEIPVFNIIKIHGSLTWKQLGEKIGFSHDLDHFDDSISKKKGKEFLKRYNKILVVNPEESKHLESVLNLYYYELLRMYSSELEKENATLFIIGFSMDDKHIREITLRAAKANPTLRIFICCSQASKDKVAGKMEASQHLNIQILTPEDVSVKFTIDYFADSILKKVNGKVIK